MGRAMIGSRTIPALLLAAVLAVGPLAAGARADGDPASDYLLTNRVFLATQAGRPAAAERQLILTVAAAGRAGFPVRVATIPSRYDLGAITELWHRPQLYARFLGLELARVHPGPLLVVMPNGFGVSWPGHSTAVLEHRLAGISLGGASGLAAPAAAAVRVWSRSAGFAVPSVSVGSAPPARSTAPAPSGDGRATGVLPWLAAVVALGALIWLAIVLVRRRPRWLPVGFAILACGAFAVPILLVVSVRRSGAGSATAAAAIVTPPPVSWPPGARAAPDFALRDQAGHAVSVSALRGRPLIVTFVDPLCRSLCPLEAHVLNAAIDALAPSRRPVILAVSTDIWANARRNLLQDVQRWSLVPQWHWAVGAPGALRDVWRRYGIGVAVVTRKLGRSRLRYITHSEAAYVVDATGHERAVFAWPFAAQDVVRELGRVAAP